MVNLRYQIYRRDIVSLVKSMVIKHPEEMNLMNRFIRARSSITGIDVDYDDPKTWKFYLNISGQYHAYDEMMIVKSLDTGEDIIFNIANLDIHKATAKAYTYGTSFYENLVFKYPDQELLIKGIINPVNIDVAITAPDFAILSYDTTKIESNESNLLLETQKWIDNFFLWSYNRNFVYLDDLYLPSIMGVFYSQLATMIESIRFANCGTFKVHSFHLWNHLDSFAPLSQYKAHLTAEQALWLYRNIRWLSKNAGKKDTHNILVDKLLTARNIPLTKYELVQDISDLSTALKPTLTTEKIPLNITQTSDTATADIELLYQKQIPLAKDNEIYQEESLAELRRRMDATVLTRLPTKVYESDIINQSEKTPILFSDILLSYWIYFAFTDEYDILVSVTHPNTAETLSMRPKEAFIVWSYVVNRSFNVTLNTIPTFTAKYINVLPQVTEEDLDESLDLSLILATNVDNTVFTSSITFYDYVNELYKAMMLRRDLYASQHNFVDMALYQEMFLRIYQSRKFTVAESENQTYSEYLAAREFDLENLTREEYAKLEGDIRLAVLGLDSQNDLTLEDVQRSLLDIMAYFGTYDTQYIQTVNSEPVIVMEHILSRPGNNRVNEKMRLVHSTVDNEEAMLTKTTNEVAFAESDDSYLFTTTNQNKAITYHEDISTVQMASYFKYPSPIADNFNTLQDGIDFQTLYGDPNFMDYLLEAL